MPMYIKLYVTRQEKEQLENIAAKRQISLSKLCYEKISVLLSNPLEISTDKHMTTTNSQKLDHCVKVYFTETEYQSLLSSAKGIPLSRYMRREYFSHKEPVTISIYTNDISTLTLKVSAYIEQLNNFIAAMAIRRQLYESDYQKLIQLVSDTQTALRDAATYARANRKSIRSSGVRILRKEIKKALENQLNQNNPNRKDVK